MVLRCSREKAGLAGLAAEAQAPMMMRYKAKLPPTICAAVLERMQWHTISNRDCLLGSMRPVAIGQCEKRVYSKLHTTLPDRAQEARRDRRVFLYGGRSCSQLSVREAKTGTAVESIRAPLRNTEGEGVPPF